MTVADVRPGQAIRVEGYMGARGMVARVKPGQYRSFIHLSFVGGYNGNFPRDTPVSLLDAPRQPWERVAEDFVALSDDDREKALEAIRRESLPGRVRGERQTPAPEMWYCLTCGKQYPRPTWQEGFHPDGSPAGVYYCPTCRRRPHE